MHGRKIIICQGSRKKCNACGKFKTFFIKLICQSSQYVLSQPLLQLLILWNIFFWISSKYFPIIPYKHPSNINSNQSNFIKNIGAWNACNFDNDALLILHFYILNINCKKIDIIQCVIEMPIAKFSTNDFIFFQYQKVYLIKTIDGIRLLR